MFKGDEGGQRDKCQMTSHFAFTPPPPSSAFALTLL